MNTNEKPTGPETFKVPEANLPLLKARIEKLNKRAAKLGCPAIAVNILSEHEVPRTKYNPVTCENEVVSYRKYFELTVTGAAPKINGWEFVAVIQPSFDEEGKNLGNILRSVPGATSDVPAEYRKAESKCDHCHTDRRRNETFILRSESGDTKQVGRSCLRDFLGHTAPEVYCSIAQMLLDARDLASDSEGDDFGGGHVIDRFQAEEILTLAACSIRLNGWRSNKTAREYGSLSTSAEVGNWIFTTQKDKWEKPLNPSDEDKATAKEVAEWLTGLASRTDLNDYLYSLSLLGQGATFTEKNFGLACSAIPTYLREQEQEINRRKRFESDAASQYIGTVGSRERVTATLVFTTDFETNFGVTHLYKFKDEAGNILVWFASSVYYNTVTGQDINIGDTVTLNATVKSHEDYKGVKQTIITRCTAWKSPEEKKAAKKAAKEQAARVAEMTEANPNYTNPYHNDFGKDMRADERFSMTAEHGDVIAAAL
jgi:hypothetical protein